jgi:AbrB family looped-hinge helix DNA binding protein
MPLQKLSSKNQIVIPKEARASMKVRAGDELLVVVKGDVTIVMHKPSNYPKALRGIGRGLFSTDHLERERGSW